MDENEKNEELMREQRMEEERIKEEQSHPDEDPKFIHRDQPDPINPHPAHPQLPPDEDAAKKRRRKWIIIGIILLVAIGIPLILFGTCILLINQGGV